MKKYLFFDLDETVTESKQKATPEMLAELSRLIKELDKYKVTIVSGAEIERMKIQVPLDVMFMSQNGNRIYENNKLVLENKFENKEAVYKHIDILLKETNIPLKEDMVEDRGSQISLSFIGHHAPLEEKKKFDPSKQKRTQLLLKHPFPNAFIGGTTCIDYIPKTKGDNIKRYIEDNGINRIDCLYFGDALQGMGNDATVCGIIPTFEVKDPLDTFNFIKNI